MLPPGPRTPPLFNGLRYARDPLRYFPRLRERYGDIFTVSFPDFPEVVYVAEPALVSELFTGDPRDLHAGEANATVLEPALGPHSRADARRRRRTCASASCCCRPSTARRSSATAS